MCSSHHIGGGYAACVGSRYRYHQSEHLTISLDLGDSLHSPPGGHQVARWVFPYPYLYTGDSCLKDPFTRRYC